MISLTPTVCTGWPKKPATSAPRVRPAVFAVPSTRLPIAYDSTGFG